jgi:iron complex transport system ATP-binding protein
MTKMEMVIDSVCKDYATKRVLDSVSFSMGQGEIVALVGPNGSGKSTLIKAIAGIHKETSGNITLDGKNLHAFDPIDLAKMIGYVPQHFTYTLYSTVFETVLLGRRQHIKWAVSDEELSRVQQSLDALEMGHMAGMFMDQLAVGSARRASSPAPLLRIPGSSFSMNRQAPLTSGTRSKSWKL